MFIKMRHCNLNSPTQDLSVMVIDLFFRSVPDVIPPAVHPSVLSPCDQWNSSQLILSLREPEKTSPKPLIYFQILIRIKILNCVWGFPPPKQQLSNNIDIAWKRKSIGTHIHIYLDMYLNFLSVSYRNNAAVLAEETGRGSGGGNILSRAGEGHVVIELSRRRWMCHRETIKQRKNNLKWLNNCSK